MSRAHDPHEGIVWARGAGPFLWDASGRRYLDCISGYSANNFGHGHPELVRTMQEQASKGAHVPGAESHIRRELEQHLASLLSKEVLKTLGWEAWKELGAFAESPDYAVWLSTTGARAIEVAWKIAYACRPGVVVCFDLGYHGRSLASSLLSDTARSGVIGPHAGLGNANIVRTIPFPRESGQVSMEEACESSLKEFQRMLERDSASLSMLILEPAIGARGYYFAPNRFYQRLVGMARAAGLLVVSDEIQMGLGRLAGLSGALGAGWLPDMFVYGKSLGGGLLPVSAVVGDSNLMNQLGAGLESETFAAQPLACAVAMRSLELLQSEELADRSRDLHTELRTGLSEVMPASCVVGCGSATAIDFAVAVGSQNARELAWRWVVAARELGVLLHLTGPMRDRVAIIPPLVIQPWEMNEVRAALVQAWEVVQRGVSD
ncbi:MAG: aminotransferase class III-fold pyridoxal phosphate-dependent enzyme [Pirellula sp.]|nr:aminotransferase class III-fold pyridoxal phosphate-dependent enzyme [Pirellula sp.]